MNLKWPPPKKKNQKKKNPTGDGVCPVNRFYIAFDKVIYHLSNCYHALFRIFLFAGLELLVLLENCSLIWRRHHCRWRDANSDLCSALMIIKQCGFFSLTHLLRRGASVYNGHLRGLVALTPAAERFAVELF